jgi:predicted  nucleic acid-binding Zn-ribbon protein
MAKKPGGNAAKPTAPRGKRSAPKRAPKIIDLNAKTVKPPPQPAQTAAAKSGPPHRPEPPMPNVATKAEPNKSAPPKTEAPKQTRAAKSASPATGFGALLAAALIGGVVALGGAWIIGAFEAGSRVADADVAALQQRLTQLEETEPVDDGINEEAIATLVDARIADAGAGDVPASITARLDALENQSQVNGKEIAAVSSAINAIPAAENGASAEQITALQARLTTLEDATVPRDKETVAALEDLFTRNDILAEQVSEAASTGEAVGEQLATLTGQVEDLARAIETVRQTAAEAEGKATAAGALAQATMDEAVKAVTDLETTTQTQIAALNDRIENGTDKLAARAFAAAALKRDIDRGEPFETSLATLQSLVDDPTDLDVLAPFSGSGVVPTATLISQFQNRADDILTAAAPSSEEGSLTERLLAGARNAVQFRTAADDDAGDALATIAGINEALSEGRLEDAAALWNELPEAAQKVSGDWHNALQARIEANNLVANSVDAFLQRQAGE